MARVMYLSRLCSPVEQRLLKNLRVLGWTESWPVSAVFSLEDMGIDLAQAVSFLRLVETILEVHPEFELFGPASPFISADELNLLASLALASRKPKGRNVQASATLPGVLDNLVDVCGKLLHKSEVALKSRALLQNGRSLTRTVS
jgi:hypothetical protein